MASFSIHDATKHFFKTLTDSKENQDLVKNIEVAWENIIETEPEKRTALDQAFREALCSKLSESGS